MTDHDLEQRLRAWYRAEIDDRESAPFELRSDLRSLAQTAATTRRTVVPGWRSPAMLRFTPVALAAAAIITMVVVGTGLVMRPPDVGPPIDAPSRPAETEAVFDVALHYYTTTGTLIPVSEPARIHVPVPDGWVADESGIQMGSEESSLAVSFWAVEAVFIDRCARGRADPPMMATLHGLAGALSAWWQADGPDQLSATLPVPTTVSGFRAQYLELRFPDDGDTDACVRGRYATWRNADGVERHHQAGDASRIWIVEVGSPPALYPVPSGFEECCPMEQSTPLLVIDATSTGEAPPEALRELDELIESIRIEEPAEEPR